MRAARGTTGQSNAIDWTSFFTPRVTKNGKALFYEKAIALENKAAVPVEFRLRLHRVSNNNNAMQWGWWPSGGGEHVVTVQPATKIKLKDATGRLIGCNKLQMTAVLKTASGDRPRQLGTFVTVEPNGKLQGLAAYEAKPHWNRPGVPAVWSHAIHDPGLDEIRARVRARLDKARQDKALGALRVPPAVWSHAQILAETVAQSTDARRLEQAAVNGLKGLKTAGRDFTDGSSFWLEVKLTTATAPDDIAKAAVTRMLGDDTAIDLLLSASARELGVGAERSGQATVVTIVALQPR